MFVNSNFNTIKDIVALPESKNLRCNNLNLESIKDLIDGDLTLEKLKINYLNKNNLFHYIAQLSDFELIEKLFNKIKDGNIGNISALILQKNDDHKTPFHLAIENGNLQIFILFKENCADEVGSTPLHEWAIQKNYHHIEEFLSQCKEDFHRQLFLTILDGKGNTPFSLCLKDEKLISICLGTFNYSKNIYDLLAKKIFKNYSKEFPSYMLLLLGSVDLDAKKLDAIFKFFTKDLLRLELLLLQRNINLSTPLHLVIENQNIENNYIENIKVVLSYINLLDKNSQEKIFLAEDDDGNNPFLLLPYWQTMHYTENNGLLNIPLERNSHSQNPIETQLTFKKERDVVLPLIYAAVPKEIKDKIIESQNNNGDSLFHLLTKIALFEKVFFENNIYNNAKNILGKLIESISFPRQKIMKLTNKPNQENETVFNLINTFIKNNYLPVEKFT